jgi:hypothetical protein
MPLDLIGAMRKSGRGSVEFRSDLYGRDGISELVASYSNSARGAGASRDPTMSP